MTQHVPHETLALYAAGSLGSSEAAHLRSHLQTCPACRQALAEWQALSQEIARQNRGLVVPPLEALKLTLPTSTSPWQRAWALLSSQVRVVRSELWLTTLLIVVIGVVVTILLEAPGLLYALGPLVAAASAALVYGREQDPAAELILTTPVSQVQLLLARLVLVVGYDLFLFAAANLAAMLVLGPQPLSTLVAAWLAPLTFLTALALFLSLQLGSANAVTVAYGLWILRYVMLSEPVQAFGSAWYILERFWASPHILLLAGSLLFALSLWQVNQARFNGRNLA